MGVLDLAVWCTPSNVPESSIEHESSKDTCNIAFIAAFAFVLYYLKPPKITQFIH